jgi:hypothetical protein
VGFLDPGDGFLRIDAVISGANAFERFLGLKTTTGTSADMVVAEEGPLSAWELLQQLPHGDLWRYRHGVEE